MKSVRATQGDELGMLLTKSGHRYPSIEIDSARQLKEAAVSADVVWIDEPMLFPDEAFVFDQVQRIRKRSIVLISTLSATDKMKVFGSSTCRLLAVADDVIYCKADCDGCGRMRAATRSLCVIHKTDTVLVGGEEAYKAVCPSCWRKAARGDVLGKVKLGSRTQN